MPMGCSIWPAMFGNGVVTGTGLIIIRSWLKIKYLIIQKVLMIHWIRQSPAKKRKFSAAAHFYVQISIVRDTWLGAGVKVNSAPPPITWASGALKNQPSAKACWQNGIMAILHNHMYFHFFQNICPTEY